jgi:hypothetical protein
MPVALHAMAGSAIAFVHQLAIAHVARVSLGDADGNQHTCDQWS